MGKYDSLLDKNSKKPEQDFSKNKYVSLLGDKKTSFKERLTGIPTKQYNGTYKANTGILPFLGEIGKTLNEGTIGTGKTLGESISVNRGDFDTLNKANETKRQNELNLLKDILKKRKEGKDVSKLIKGYEASTGTKMDTIETLAPNSQVSNREALANLGMMSAGILGAGSLSSLSKSTGYLSSKVEKELLKNLTKEQLKKNLIKDVASNAGVGYLTDVSMKAKENPVTGKTFLPGLGTALGALAPAALGSQSMNKILTGQSAARIAEKYGVKYNIPEAGIPSSKFMQENNRMLPLPSKTMGQTPIEMNSPEINASIRKLNEIPSKVIPETPKTPLESRAANSMSRQDFINKERASINLARDINKNKFTKGSISDVPKTTDKQLSDIWDKQHSTPKQEGLPPLQQQIIKQGIPTQSNQPKVEQPNINQEVPKEQVLKDELNNIDNQAQDAINNDPLKVDSINLVAEGEKAKVAINTLGKEKARRIALGIDAAPEGVKATAIHSELTNIAQRENDYILGKELATSDLFKPSAQDINLAKNREPNSFYWAIKDISDSLRKKQNIVTKMNEKSAINNIAQKIRKSIESVNLDNLSIKKLAASLICK